jgi:hypothetical protein
MSTLNHAQGDVTLRKRLISCAAIAVLAIASPAAIAVAQAPASAHMQKAAAGPTVAASVVGVKRAEAAKTLAPAAETRLGAGKNVALMVVGGAALIIGAVIGGTPGVIIAVTGAAIGLYGLYNFVQ